MSTGLFVIEPEFGRTYELAEGANVALTKTATQLVIAATGGGGSLSIRDEGSDQGVATVLDFVGAGVTASVSSGIATITISGGGSGTPGGSDTQVQYNDGGAFGGDAGLTYDDGGKILYVRNGILLGPDSQFAVGASSSGGLDVASLTADGSFAGNHSQVYVSAYADAAKDASLYLEVTSNIKAADLTLAVNDSADATAVFTAFDMVTVDGPLSVTDLATTQVVYVGAGGRLKGEANFFYTEASNALTIDDGRFLGRTTSDVLHPLDLFKYSDDDAGAFVGLWKSRATTIGGAVIVADDDVLGQISAYGYDSAAYQEAAAIKFIVDGAPGDGDLPGRIEFWTTPDGSTTPVLSTTIDQAQNVTIAGSITVADLTATRVPYASTGGLLVDSANMTFDGSQLALAVQGNTGGLLVGGDVQWYRSAADVWRTPDSVIVDGHIAAAARFAPIVGGRLTLATGTPITVSDVTGATTIFYTPHTGAAIALYDGARWVLREFSEISIAVPATRFRVFDLFAYWTGSAVALETANWNQTTQAATAATAAAPCVVTVGAGHPFAVGDLVGTADFNNTVGTDANNGINGRTWRVSATTSTTITLHDSNTAGLVASTTGNVFLIPNTRATALARQDGVLVKSGDPTRRFLGMGMTFGVSGQCEDSAARRLLVNYYNRVQRLLSASSTASHTYNVAAARLWNLDWTLKRHVLAFGEDAIFASQVGRIVAASGGNPGFNNWAVDNPAAPPNSGASMANANTQHIRGAAASGAGPGVFSAGYHFVAPTEFGNATAAPTFFDTWLSFLIPG